VLNNLLENTCEKFKDKTALIFFEKKYSFENLKETSLILASAFIHLNIQPNDKVAFFLTNCPEAIVCFTACFKIGAVAVPINQYFNAAQLTYVLNEAKPKILITEKELLPELLKIPREILASIDCYLTDDSENPSLKSFHSLLNLTHSLSLFPAVPNNQLATLSYTSGSTGTPKGVMHTQSQLYKFIVTHAQLVKYNVHDHVLICVPMAFAYSFSNQVLPCLYSGVTISLIPAGNYEKVIHAIQNNHFTLL
jgi:long-chain acyl-CoA synthetase